MTLSPKFCKLKNFEMETNTLQTFGFAAHFSKKLEDGEFAPFLRPR